MFIRLALVLVVLCLTPSCGVLSRQKSSLPVAPPYPAGFRPLFLALYHPYPDFSALPSDISPLPSYTSWPVSRMERDLERMRGVGFDGVLLVIAPKDLADPFTAEAISQFLALAAAPSSFPASASASVFKVGLLLAPSAPMALREENVTRYLESKNLLSSPSILLIAGKPFIGFNEKVSLTPDPHSPGSRRQLGRDWPAMPSGREAGASSLGQDGVCWVLVADNGGRDDYQADGGKKSEWPLSRSRGVALAEGLRQAFALQARIILVSSWNNYRNGSFMEPNTLDQDVMGKVMRHELNRMGF